MSETFTAKNLADSRFENVSLERATFDDVNLKRASFRNINLSGASFSDINLSNVVIEKSCIEGLTIDGFDVHALVDAERARRGG